MDSAAFFILNIFLNSFLAFITVVLLLESVIFLFRVPQGRVVAVLRMIPIIKLPLDLFLYDFSRWSYLQGINPLNCAENTRMLLCGWVSSITGWPVIQLAVHGDFTFTVADIVGYSLNPIAVSVFSLVVVSVTLLSVIQRVFSYFRCLKALDSLALDAKPLNRKMRNSALASRIDQCKVQIVTSSTLAGAPFVAGLLSSTVYLSSEFSKKLNRREYEAVLAHELEHVRYKDSLTRLALDFVGAVFWWIPTTWLRHRIEEGQEVGCDLNCRKYGIHLSVMSSAIYKSAKYAMESPNMVFAHHLTRCSILKRIKILARPASVQFRRARFIFTSLAIGIAFLTIFWGRFWIF